jgi:hypothetical protein
MNRPVGARIDRWAAAWQLLRRNEFVGVISEWSFVKDIFEFT